MSIEVKNLTHTYMPDTPYSSTAVRNVSFTVEDGEFVGLIGHTGSGKSTLVQHLNGLLRPTSGSVWINGRDINENKADLRRVRFQVGLVFQYPEYQLFEETVRKDIGFGPRNLGLSEAEIAERVAWAARLSGVAEDRLEKSPFELSGGQKRRVAIAGVLAMRPSTLVLDEPAAGLDPRGRAEMFAFLKELHEKERITLIMVSHSMGDVAKLCSRVLVMNRGELAMDGTPTEIFSESEKLREMGLGIPQAAELAQILRDHGFGIPQDVWSIEWLARALLNEWKGGAAVD
ncbi:MAG: energy-coupling factor transporter ATPase [Clostridia bacterium]|nr:energy-coupling factor transporter ATPase [Clostridia bacterium]